LMRQLFDHFFAAIAPDADVRQSQYFHTKEGKYPNKVHRVERLHYAASRLSAPEKADLLLRGADELLSLYERLNMLHARQALNREHIRVVLLAMQAQLESWIDSLREA